MGDTPKPRRRLCLQPSHLTQPSLTVREGFEPLPKPLANPWQGDVIDSGQKPPSVKDFLYGSRAFALPGVITPSRVRHIFYADYAKRWSATALGEKIYLIDQRLA